jgi:acyl-coenzyme A synthetase/AMP-(fatty) acid ligase/acyl carrier protein
MGWDHNALLAHVDYTIPEAMREIVRQIPDQVALDDGIHRITYDELVERANRVANALLDREAHPETPIALLCGHGTAPAIGLCGVVHAGLIGAPVDAREPLERLQKLLAASGAQLVVTEGEYVELARSIGLTPIVIDESAGRDAGWPCVEISDDHPSMVLFTSGSTGVPKGVFNAHRMVVPRCVGYGVKHGLRIGERYVLTTSFGFVAAEGTLFTVLLNGGALCLYDLRTRGPRDLPAWVRANEIVELGFVPATIRALAQTTPPGTMDCVRRVNFGADTLYGRDIELARPLFGPSTQLRNGLGSTEAGHIASFDVPPEHHFGDGPIPVGTPDPDDEIRLVDDDDQPVPDGEVGRIVIVRPTRMALGYWNDPELTRRHFFREPDGRYGFRAPDSARLRDDGLLEHVARIDSRVKVHGAMVATSEVEMALLSHPDVADAAVVAVPETSGTRLVAYVVARTGAALSAWKLRRDLAAELSSPAVPSAYVALDEVPRTVRNKIDRGALPPPPPPVRPRPYREPLEHERDLAAVFADVLGVERVGRDDDFFELGGDSLGVVELTAAIAQRCFVDVPASSVLDAPTVAQLSLRLSHRRPRDASPVVALRIDAGGDPLFCITGGGTPAISFRTLSETMPDRNLYAIQPRGLEERAVPDYGVVAAARRNVSAMRAMQPTGPYALAGFSYGGIVAFEMACQLRFGRRRSGATGDHRHGRADGAADDDDPGTQACHRASRRYSRATAAPHLCGDGAISQLRNEVGVRAHEARNSSHERGPRTAQGLRAV